ncbi:AfsR/SARP family transcriptional regulator [Actinoallomurus iriomotensis]|uniref:SARP family transcriptional regulator n=1 Tax=Actinoallomurus iriomotensis TaxID=478107 RepID=A0A9W6VP51_9ACTN|nr:BTAD domain-containing putative transcriptional regulator [Actinoallomurus iriomotensis]GLY79538.1 SARP family transcriptional regulator [Actinoallomurus iriomotensis]
MDFRVLGPVTVRTDSGERVASGGKLWTFAALLLVHPGETVARERVITEIWNGAPPPSAGANLRTYAMGLRRLLGSRAGRFTGHPAGYRLDVEPVDVDLCVFERHAAAGRAALPGDPATAAEHFGRALGLWRGAPLAGPRHGPVLAMTAEILDEQRLNVGEDRFAALLDLGRYEEAAGGLRRHLAGHPLRERAWVQLMTALYRQGDPAAALAAYADARAALADGLGIDPGEELRALQQVVLRRDELPPPRRALITATVAAEPAAPRQLPRVTPFFVGRAAELAAIRSALEAVPDGPVAVAVHGPGGVGKSALVLRAAHAAAARFPDGQLYADLRGTSLTSAPVPATTVLARFLRALDVPSAEISGDPDEDAARLRSVLADRRLLVVLDNAAGAEQVTPLLPATAGCAVLITGRRPLDPLDAIVLPVNPLSEAEAVRLLAELAGTERIDAEPEAAARVVRHGDRLPLAVRVAGARLAARPEWPVAMLADRLDDDAARLDELRHGDLAVRTCLRVGYRDLAAADPVAARALRLAGAAGLSHVRAQAVAALLDDVPRVARDALDRLADAQLVHAEGPDSYRMHDLVRLFAAELASAEDGGDGDAALRRLASHYLGTAREAARCLRDDPVAEIAGDWLEPDWAVPPPFTGPSEAVAWLEAERDGMVALARRLADTPDRSARLAIDLMWVLQSYLPRGGHWSDYALLAEQARRVADRLGDRRGEILAWTILSGADQQASRFDAAAEKLNRALGLAQRTGSPTGEASVLSHLGHLYQLRGDDERALTYYARALSRYELMKLPLQRGLLLHNIGEIHLARGDAEEAVALLDAALRLQRGCRDRLGAALTLAMLTVAYCELDRHDAAQANGTEAVRLAAETGHRQAEWLALLGRAESLLRLGRVEESREAANTALEVAARPADDYRRALATYALARAADALGRVTEARTLWDRATALRATTRTPPLPVLERLLHLPTASAR